MDDPMNLLILDGSSSITQDSPPSVDPVGFLHELAERTQLLACLRWLGEFHVLACVPLKTSVPLKDVAHLVNVPESQLVPVIRFTATAGFLCEPQPGHVAHTILSAHFVTSPTLLDTLMFLTQVAVPSSMQMSAATKRTDGTFGSTDSSCYNIAFNTATAFATTCSGCGKTQRQAAAFEQLTGDGSDNGDIMDILPCLDWLHLNDVIIVEVNARSTATADSLSSLLPSLSFIVQYHEPEDTGLSRIRPQRSLSAAPLPYQPLSSTGSNPRVSIQYRTPGTPQIVEGAAVYIIHLPQASLSRPVQSVINESVVELKAHFAALRAHPNSVVILVARVLPEPGTVNSDVERAARLRNLSMHQIAKVQDPGVQDITEVLNKASDGSFRLFLVNKYISRKSSVMAFEVRCWAL